MDHPYGSTLWVMYVTFSAYFRLCKKKTLLSSFKGFAKLQKYVFVLIKKYFINYRICFACGWFQIAFNSPPLPCLYMVVIEYIIHKCCMCSRAWQYLKFNTEESLKFGILETLPGLNFRFFWTSNHQKYSFSIKKNNNTFHSIKSQNLMFMCKKIAYKNY